MQRLLRVGLWRRALHLPGLGGGVCKMGLVLWTAPFSFYPLTPLCRLAAGLASGACVATVGTGSLNSSLEDVGLVTKHAYVCAKGRAGGWKPSLCCHLSALLKLSC